MRQGKWLVLSRWKRWSQRWRTERGTSAGASGAALSWTLRTILDAVLLFAASHKLLPRGQSGVFRTIVWAGGVSLLFAAATQLTSVFSKGVFALIALPVIVGLGLHQAGGIVALRGLLERSSTREIRL